MSYPGISKSTRQWVRTTQLCTMYQLSCCSAGLPGQNVYGSLIPNSCPQGNHKYWPTACKRHTTANIFIRGKLSLCLCDQIIVMLFHLYHLLSQSIPNLVAIRIHNYGSNSHWVECEERVFPSKACMAPAQRSGRKWRIQRKLNSNFRKVGLNK